MVTAIIFDLYDTLIYRDEDVTNSTRNEIAARLGVSPADLSALWRKYRNERMLGVIPTLEEHLRLVASDLGVDVTPDEIAALAALERKGVSEAVRLYAATLPTLDALRGMGFKLGLLSNASDVAEEPLWRLGLGDRFDSIVLSHKVGILKPDLRIFALAAEELRTPPGRCAFVADGGFSELDAAHEAGMLAVKVEQAWQSQDYGSSTYCDVCLRDLGELVVLAREWRAAEDKE